MKRNKNTVDIWILDKFSFQLVQFCPIAKIGSNLNGIWTPVWYSDKTDEPNLQARYYSIYVTSFSNISYNVKVACMCFATARSSQAKRRNKSVFNYCQTSVLSLSTLGSLVDHRAWEALHLSGTPSLTTGTSPLSC